MADLDNKHRDASWKDIAAELKSERDALRGDVLRIQQERDELIAALPTLKAKLAAAEAELERWRNVTARRDPDDCAVGIKTLYDNWQREKEARATAERERDAAMKDAERLESLLREARGHLSGYKMSMLARTPERLVAAINDAIAGKGAA